MSLTQNSFRKSKRFFYLLAFFIPFCIVGASFCIGGLWPFGDKQILAHDMWHQYYPFFVSFREKLRSGGSLQYIWDVGMGTGYLSLFAYYLASPLYLLSVLVPTALLREFFALLVIVKISLASLFFAVFLRTTYRRNDFSIVFFSLMYALCSFVAGYYWNIIWLDTFALLPLLVTGTVSLLRDGKFRLYIAALALSLWCNYYLSFFCCIFIFFCFLGYCVCCWNGFRNFLRRFARIAVCTVIGVGITAVLLLPTLRGLQNTHSIEGEAPNLLALNIAKNANGTVLAGESTLDLLKDETLPGVLTASRQVLANLLTSTTPTKMEGLPNVFCGFSAVVLAVFYCCCGKIRLREKIFSLGLLLFFLLSFIFRTLDYFWHGFHFPNMLPYRQSFLFSFVLISMAYRAYTQLDHFKKWHLAIIVPVCAGIIVCSLGLEDSTKRIALSTLILFGVIAALLFYGPSRQRKSISLCILACIITAELSLGFALGVARVALTTRSSYPRESEDVQSVLESHKDPLGRTEVVSYQSLNDGALNGYRGVTIFTSSANARFNRFSRSLGLASWPASNRYVYYESSPFTNLMCGIHYLIDRDGQQNNKDYTQLVARSGKVKLLENTAYLGLGFMTDSALGEFVAEEKVYNPFPEQEEMFRLATGITEPLYTHLTYSELDAPSGCTLTASGTSGTQYSYSTKEANLKSELSIRFIVPEDGLLCATTKSTGNYDLSVYCNGEKRFTRNIKVRSLFSLGNFSAGDVVTLTYPVEKDKEGTISLDVAMQNNDTFNAGFELLSQSTWQISEYSDTHLSGTVHAAKDGLFYTSIPYEAGWHAYVDGKEVSLATGASTTEERVRLTDALISFPLTAGTHTIVLRYHAPGLTVGAIISALSLLACAALWYFLRKRPLLLPDLPKPPVPNESSDSDSLPDHADTTD